MKDSVCPSGYRVCCCHALVERPTDLQSLFRWECGQSKQGLSKRRCVVLFVAELRLDARDKRVEDGARAEDRQAGGRGFVHDFVGGARAGVADECVCGGKGVGDLVVGDGVSEGDLAL